MATKPRQHPSAAATTAAARARLSPDALLKMYFFMMLNREFENTILRLYNQGKVVGGAYSGYGNEATAIGSAFALEPQDYLLPIGPGRSARRYHGASGKEIGRAHV